MRDQEDLKSGRSSNGDSARKRELDRRTHVCHVVVRPLLDGAQLCMLEMIEGLDPQRYERSVICGGVGPLTEVLAERGIHYHLAPSLRTPLNPWRDLAALREVYAICRGEGIDLLHSHSSKGGFIGRLAGRLARVPRILHHVHGYAFHDESPPIKRWCYERMEKLAARWANKVIFVNDEEREMSVAEGLMPAHKALTIHNGVDLSVFAGDRLSAARRTFRAAHDIGDDELIILVCGRLAPQKQSLIVPNIAAELRTLCPDRPWRILVLGEGVLERPLRAAIARAGVQDRVWLFGSRRETFDVYAGSDIALLPSLWEGLPRVLLEAQACALPCVVSNIKGNREAISVETGVLCSPKRPDDYARALHRLIDDPALRVRMGKAAQERAQDVFDLSHQRESLARVYQDLLGER